MRVKIKIYIYLYFILGGYYQRRRNEHSESSTTSSNPQSIPPPPSTEGRKPLNLLPRTKPADPVTSDLDSSKNASIFGTGKPRDINKPEIKELEERLEKTLILSRQQQLQASADGSNKDPSNEYSRTLSSSSTTNTTSDH
jgi:hypothetical protein